jgi:pimeloyl-ACP methyl ester carboxylesterase
MMTHTASRTEQLTIRGLRYCVRHWGDASAPKLFLLHGWMDSSPTFQFVVDALKGDWHVIAPDWRGFGATEWLSRPYWFPDYYADLDALLAHYAPNEAVRLVGHSMGANIGGIYAGLRPQRVARLAMLDFLGLPVPQGVEAPDVLGKWLDAARAAPAGETPALRIYPDHAALAHRLRVANPRLGEAQADFLSRTVSRQRADGGVEMAGDPWHKVPSPFVYRIEDAMACWRRVLAPVLVVIAEQGYVQARLGADPDELERRLACFAERRVLTLAGAGHNVQHDQPERLACMLEDFFAPA